MSISKKPSCPSGYILRESYKKVSGKTIKARCIRKPGILPGKSSNKSEKKIEELKTNANTAIKMSRKSGLHISSRCKKNQILRSGYIKKTSKHKTLVIPRCITKRGKSIRIHGEPSARIIIDDEDHFLSEFGYFDIVNKTKEERHIALHKLIKHFIPIKGEMATYNYVIRALNARYILNRNTNPNIAKIFKIDQKVISKEYKNIKNNNKQ